MKLTFYPLLEILMNTKGFFLATMLVIATSIFPIASATAPTNLEISLVGNSEIDLDWEEKDRILRTWVSFENFEPNDGNYKMEIIQTSTGNLVSESEIRVWSTVDTPVNFGSFSLYLVDEFDICQDAEAAEDEDSENCNPMTGDYEMKVSTKDGSVNQRVPFSIVDSRL